MCKADTGMMYDMMKCDVTQMQKQPICHGEMRSLIVSVFIWIQTTGWLDIEVDIDIWMRNDSTVLQEPSLKIYISLLLAAFHEMFGRVVNIRI